MICIDKYGWPVELIKGRWMLNFFRRLFLTRKFYRGTFQQWDKEWKEKCIAKMHNNAMDNLRVPRSLLDSSESGTMSESSVEFQDSQFARRLDKYLKPIRRRIYSSVCPKHDVRKGV